MRGHGWLTMAFWMGTAAVSAAGQDPLTVVVSDSAGVPDEDMTHAIEMGRRNFAVAGIETSWSVCRRDACTLPREGGYVQISIVPRMNFSIPGLAAGQVLGWAHKASAADGRPLAYVFHNSVKRAAENASQPVSGALAWVMVHEVSHLLGLEHAPLGAMHETPRSQDLRDVARGSGFAPTQTKHLRAGVTRLSAAANSTRNGRQN